MNEWRICHKLTDEAMGWPELTRKEFSVNLSSEILQRFRSMTTKYYQVTVPNVWIYWPENFLLFPDDTQSPPSFKESLLTSSSLSAQNPADTEGPVLSSVSTPLPSSPSPSAALSNPSADPDTPSPAHSPSSGEPEEEKAKKLLYCSLCKVAVNSLSQLEAHNKGWSSFKHILLQAFKSSQTRYKVAVLEDSCKF